MENTEMKLSPEELQYLNNTKSCVGITTQVESKYVSSLSGDVKITKDISLMPDGSVDEACFFLAVFGHSGQSKEIRLTPNAAMMISNILAEYAKELTSKYGAYFIEQEKIIKEYEKINS